MRRSQRRREDRERDRQRKQKELHRKGAHKRDKREHVERSGRIEVDAHSESVMLDLIARLIREERELRAQGQEEEDAQELARRAVQNEGRDDDGDGDGSDSDEDSSSDDDSDSDSSGSIDDEDGEEENEVEEEEAEDAGNVDEEEDSSSSVCSGEEKTEEGQPKQDFEYSNVFAEMANLSLKDSKKKSAAKQAPKAQAAPVPKAQSASASQGGGQLSKSQKKQLVKDLVRDERRNENTQTTPSKQSQIPELQALHQQRQIQAGKGSESNKKRHSKMLRVALCVPGKPSKPAIFPRSITLAEVEAATKNKLGGNKKRLHTDHVLAFEHHGQWFELTDNDFATMDDGTQISILPLTALADKSSLPAAAICPSPAIAPTSSPQPLPQKKAAPASASASTVPQKKAVDEATEVGRALISASADTREVAEEIEQQRASAAHAARIGQELMDSTNTLRQDAKYIPVLAGRTSLPAWGKKEELLSAIRHHQVVVVSGETGCGKTTQIPQFILDAMIDAGDGGHCNIVCTQPRRISAIGVAERVASERLEQVGRTVGYQIRLSVKKSAQTRMLFCTTGVLLRKLLNPEYLASVSHLLIDEVHERQVDTDFLLTFIKQQLSNYPRLRIVLMSATVQHDLFSKYFNDCPILTIEGRTFPVHIHDLNELLGVTGKNRAQSQLVTEDDRPSRDGKLRTLAGSRGQALKIEPELLADVVAHIVQNYSRRAPPSSSDQARLAAVRKQLDVASPSEEMSASKGQAILMFLPGIQAISSVSRALRKRREFSDRDKFIIFELHGTLAPEQQRKVFLRPRPGQWKIVLSTNIAETSITVEDVTHVIDTGLVREMRYDPTTNMSSLQEVGISCASAAQRAGRAGRVQEGHCWRCFSNVHHETRMPPFPDPEIRRIALEEVVLQVRLLDMGPPGDFLRNSPESPEAAQIGASIENLIQIGALEPTPELPLTALGFHLAHMPVDVRIGKMLIVSAILRCVDPILTIAASLSHRSPFVVDQRHKEASTNAHNRLAGNLHSDHLVIVKAYSEWATIMTTQGSDAAFAYCRENSLSMTVFEDMIALREDLRRHLVDAGFIGDDAASDNYNEHATNGLIVSSAMCAGLYPRVAHLHTKSSKSGKRGGVVISDNKSPEMYIHPGSVNFRAIPAMLENKHDVWLLYHKQLLSTKLYLHDCTVVSPLSIVLFGGELQVAKGRKKILVDRWITFKMHEVHMVLFKHLRRAINDLLTLKVHNPSADVSRRQDLILHVVSTVLAQERKYTLPSPPPLPTARRRK